MNAKGITGSVFSYYLRFIFIVGILSTSSLLRADVQNVMYIQKLSILRSQEAIDFLNKFFPEANITVNKLVVKNESNSFSLGCEVVDGVHQCIIKTSLGGISGEAARRFLGKERRREYHHDSLDIVCSYSNQELAYCNIFIRDPVLKTQLTY